MNVDFGTFSGNICFEFSVLCPLGVVNELIRVLKICRGPPEGQLILYYGFLDNVCSSVEFRDCSCGPQVMLTPETQFIEHQQKGGIPKTALLQSVASRNVNVT
jgi:hypothetical protein